MPHEYEYNELKFLVGKDARDNWKMLSEADDSDIWIHLHNHPSSYVIIENTDTIEKDDILYGCQLCKKHSKLRDKARVKCSVLSVEFVKKGKTVGEAKLLKTPDIITV